MSTTSYLNHAFRSAHTLPLDYQSKYVLFSDCHRGIGNASDNFLKNQHLYFAALQYYYRHGFTYIELGDGDELWENRNMQNIIQTHDNVFWLLSRFYEHHRLYMIYGNHDIIKKYPSFCEKKCSAYFCSENQLFKPLFPRLTFYEAIILKSEEPNLPSFFLTHGHQASFFNSTLWPVARFLVRYVWKPLETIGIQDPTSTGKNYTLQRKTEQKLNQWAINNNCNLITGHTHRPHLPIPEGHYYNTGSCIHPHRVTCIELCNASISLIKWAVSTKNNGIVYVKRTVLETTSFSEMSFS